MPRLFIFNPETDYALAAGNVHYNPPARIKKLQRDMQLVQALVASEGDAIAVTQDFDIESYPHLPHLSIVNKKHLDLVKLQDIPSFLSSDYSILPWGWNHSLRKDLLSMGINPAFLPGEEEINVLRKLSHRRTAIPFQLYLQEKLPLLDVPVAREFKSTADALDFADDYGLVYFKAPWSSSGRGVVKSDALKRDKLTEWIGGFIRKQGSVMGEKGFIRKADLATEWICSQGIASFSGYSLFETTAEGRYLNNASISQKGIVERINSLSNEWSDDILGAQQVAIDNLIAPFHNGPVGIDMLIDIEGKINPCVEINMRMTMGMMSLGECALKNISS